MNREEAKEILQPYWHGTEDAADLQVVEALAMAKNDPELGRWLEEHCTRQYILREKFRQIPVPDGLKQQIVAEHAATERAGFLRKYSKIATLVAVMAVILLVFYRWQNQLPDDATFTEYQNQMTSVILHGYGMDFETNDVTGIRSYLKQHDAPADFALSESLKQTALTGCAVESWQNRKAALVCFHTGSVSANASSSDLWLFVVDRHLVRDAPSSTEPQFSQVGKLSVASWTDGDKLYLLSQSGNAGDLKKFL